MGWALFLRGLLSGPALTCPDTRPTASRWWVKIGRGDWALTTLYDVYSSLKVVNTLIIFITVKNFKAAECFFLPFPTVFLCRPVCCLQGFEPKAFALTGFGGPNLCFLHGFNFFENCNLPLLSVLHLCVSHGVQHIRWQWPIEAINNHLRLMFRVGRPKLIGCQLLCEPHHVTNIKFHYFSRKDAAPVVTYHPTWSWLPVKPGIFVAAQVMDKTPQPPPWKSWIKSH